MKNVIRMSAMTLTLVLALVVSACSGNGGVNPDVKKVADVITKVSENLPKLESDPSLAMQTINDFNSISEYSKSDVKLSDADRDCLSDAFYELIKASGENYSKADLRNEFNDVNTLGEVTSFIYAAFMSGLQEGLAE